MQKTTLLLAAATLAFAGAASAQSTDAGAPHGLSQAEVRADLNLWNRAGLGHSALSGSDPASSFDYERRVATYQRLRSGPEYAAEVARQQAGAQVAGGTAPAVAQ